MTTAQNNVTGNFKIEGDWAQQSKRLKEKFSELTDADLKFEPGQEQELISRLSAKLNKKHTELIQLIRSLVKPVEQTPPAMSF